MNRSVYRAAGGVFIAKIGSSRFFGILCYMYGMAYKLIDALTLCRRNRNDRYTEHIFHFVDKNGTAVAAHFIHHIKCQHHGRIKFHELHGEIHITLNIRSVNNVDNTSRLFINDKTAGNDFLTAVRRERINTGQVGDKRIGMFLYLAAYPIDRNAGKITNMAV